MEYQDIVARWISEIATPIGRIIFDTDLSHVPIFCSNYSSIRDLGGTGRNCSYQATTIMTCPTARLFAKRLNHNINGGSQSDDGSTSRCHTRLPTVVIATIVMSANKQSSNWKSSLADLYHDRENLISWISKQDTHEIVEV